MIQSPLPFLSSGIPGCGGHIKETPEDFIVEEIPAYLPSGKGDHTYIFLEKRGITTLEAIRRIARHFHINERDIGYAGMKDAVGITRQYLSLPGIAAKNLEGMEIDSIRIISALQHSNKLKPGHLKGNRFRIVVRDVSPDAADLVPAILDMLSMKGVPNYFGIQRYGIHGNSHLIGRTMFQRDWHGAVDQLIGNSDVIIDEQWKAAITAYHQGNLAAALNLMPRHCGNERDVLQRLSRHPDDFERAFSVINPRFRKLYLSAFQSFLFDQVVALRISMLDKVMEGDLAWKHENGACFLVENAGIENIRAAAFEISPTGPMFGKKMKNPVGRPFAIEQDILENENLKIADFKMHGEMGMEGERRPLRIPLADAAFQIEGDVMTLCFSLPKGSYATTVLREILKNS